MEATLLIELLTEELPPKILRRFEGFADFLAAGLQEANLLAAPGTPRALVTPRRIAALIPGVRQRQPDGWEQIKGPSCAALYDGQGRPVEKVAGGFAKKCGVALEALLQNLLVVRDPKGDYVCYRYEKRGESLDALLPGIVAAAASRLPAQKTMRWGDGEAQFVRPVRGLVMLHGKRVIAGQILAQMSGNVTRGHRFLGKGRLTLSAADGYEATLESEGFVIPSFSARQERIRRDLEQAAGAARIPWDEALLDEVTALVEYPAVYAGTFSPAFLVVPQECLMLSMQHHQRYFPLLDADGKLLPRFLMVSNMAIENPVNIVQGNERVLRARLSDAKFFYDQDRKTRLEQRVPRLAAVVYHNRLGSQLDRVERIVKLSGIIAQRLGVATERAERAAYLCKADLLTDMVGEFPELQGIMGRYYALHEGEPEQVAWAIEEHYRPRFANDGLPRDNVGVCLALADKLDTLVGMFGIGLVPTGDKDPFALRRHGLGVLRLLAERGLPLDILEMLECSRALFPAEGGRESVALDVYGFLLERLKGYLKDKGFTIEEIEAVVSQRPVRIDRVLRRIEAVRVFRGLPEAESLAAADKRIRNILRKAGGGDGAPSATLLEHAAERALFDVLVRLEPEVLAQVEEAGYEQALKLLAAVKGPVDRFFDEVLVMCEEPLLRANRLALLSRLSRLVNQVADLSKLAA